VTYWQENAGGPLSSCQPWLLDVVTDPLAHPPVSLYDGTLGKQAESGPVQHAVG
jgi:hypothetical protein